MTGVEYKPTRKGTMAFIDGEAIGTFTTIDLARRAVHFFLAKGLLISWDGPEGTPASCKSAVASWSSC